MFLQLAPLQLFYSHTGRKQLEGEDQVFDFMFSQHSAEREKHSFGTDLLGICWIFLSLCEQKRKYKSICM